MPLSLPIIDISPFISWHNGGIDDTCIPENGEIPQTTAQLAQPITPDDLTPAQQDTVSALRSAVRHPGFFYLTGHGVPTWLMQTMLDQARDFYLGNSVEEKAKVVRKRVTGRQGDECDGARGWQDADARGMNDWHEALDFYAEIPTDQIAEHRAFKKQGGGWAGVDGCLEGRNLYPSHPAALRSYLTSYVDRLCAVGTAVMRAMGFALDLRDPEFFVKATDDSFWCLRLLGYPPLPDDAGKERHEDDEELIGCGAHSDYGCLTMLLTDPTPGALKVRVSGGDDAIAEQWIDADPLPGAFVVNIGDMVEQWTGGWATSTVHKVVHTGTDYRISVPFFFEPAKHVVVRQLPEFGGTEGSPEIRYWDHLISKIDGSFFRRRTHW